jgi:hypothetical protein
MEIRAAIDMEIPIVPILFDDAAMPRASNLPQAIQLLPRLNAVVIGQGRNFRSGMDGLSGLIAKLMASGG